MITPRLGLSSYAVPFALSSGRIDGFDLLQLAARQGVSTVQVCENAGLLPYLSECRRFIKTAKECGILVEWGARTLDQELHKVLVELAFESGSGFVRCVIDDRGFEPTLAEALEALLRLEPLYRQAEVHLAIENHDRFRAQDLHEMVRHAGVRIVLDTANSIGALESVEEVAAAVGDHVLNVHLKDVRAIRRPQGLGFTLLGTPVGHGQVRFESLLRSLPNVVSLTIEHWPESDDVNEFDWCEQSLTAARALIRAIYKPRNVEI